MKMRDSQATLLRHCLTGRMPKMRVAQRAMRAVAYSGMLVTLLSTQESTVSIMMTPMIFSSRFQGPRAFWRSSRKETSSFWPEAGLYLLLM